MSEALDTVATIAARGISSPETITPDEVQSLCGWILPQIDTPPTPTMSEGVRAELTARRNALKAKADKRRNESGFERNVAEIDGWVAELDAELAG